MQSVIVSLAKCNTFRVTNFMLQTACVYTIERINGTFNIIKISYLYRTNYMHNPYICVKHMRIKNMIDASKILLGINRT